MTRRSGATCSTGRPGSTSNRRSASKWSSTCLPVLQEVLQGFPRRPRVRVARDAMLALPIVEAPLETVAFEEAVDLYPSREARQRHRAIERRLSDRRLRGEKRPHRAAPRPRLRPSRAGRPVVCTQPRTRVSRRRRLFRRIGPAAPSGRRSLAGSWGRSCRAHSRQSIASSHISGTLRRSCGGRFERLRGRRSGTIAS